MIEQEEKFMRRAVELAEQAMQENRGGPFWLIFRDGKINPTK